MSISNLTLSLIDPKEKIDKDRSQGKAIWLVFGMSANPPHYGHLSYAARAAEYLGVDETFIFPAKASPFKEGIEQGSLEMKKELLAAVIESYAAEFGLSCPMTADFRELNSPGSCSYTYLALEELSGEAKKANAALYYLLSNETVKKFYLWTHPRRIVELATLVYGDRLGFPSLRDEIVSQLRAIDRAAREQAVPVVETAHEHRALVKMHRIKGAHLSFLTASGQIRELFVPAEEMRPIDPKIFEAIQNGHLPVSGLYDISSTQIRRFVNEKKDFAPYLGSKAARLIEEWELYKN